MTTKDGLVNNWINHLDCSGINGSPPPYQAFEDGTEKFPTYGALKSSDEAPISYIFCVHGNKYGVARCCDDLHGEKNDDFNQSHGLEQSIIPPARNLTGSSGSKLCW